MDFDSLVAQTVATLQRIADEFSPAALASSLAAEDQVLTDMVLRHTLQNRISIFTLETGRLHAQTLDVIRQIKATYDYDVALYRPQADAVQSYVQQNGANAFYDSLALRRECCHIRKVEPLRRALQGKRAWITGQRRAQSTTRTKLDVQEHDDTHAMEKFNPLAAWSEDHVWHYIRHHNVPYNALHDRGYPSIGCEPCTRAIEPGEDIRAGRWWWENADAKECGLHVVNGKLVRIKTAAATT